MTNLSPGVRPPALEERNARIIELYEHGNGYAEIAYMLGITKQRVYQIVKRAERRKAAQPSRRKISTPRR